MKLKTFFIFNKNFCYIPLTFTILTVLYVFQFSYVEKNLNSVIWANFTEKQNLTHSFNNSIHLRSIQNVLKNRSKEEHIFSEKLISVSDGGRLGNNICHFFSLYIFKIEFGIKAVISPKMYNTLIRIFETVPLPQLFNLSVITKRKSIYDNEFEDIYGIFKSNFIEDKNALNFTKIADYNYIRCCPCPDGNIWPYRQNFQKLLRFKKQNIKTAKYILQNALKTRKFNKSEIILVGAHIRRSDYINFTRMKNLRYPSVEYYINAFNFFRQKCKNVVFIVVSDDIEWCEINLSAKDVIILGNGNIENPQIDFTLLTLCDHHIRGLGTFGFTSAFLGRGSAVIYRKRSVDEKPILTLEELSKSNFTCDSPSKFYYVDE